MATFLYIHKEFLVRQGIELATCAQRAFIAVKRLYWPDEGVLDGRWNPLLVKKVK